jgi:hypothetical protein
VEGLDHSETEKETNKSYRVLDVGAFTILGTFTPSDRKNRMMALKLDRLASCEGTAWDSGLKMGSEGAVGE